MYRSLTFPSECKRDEPATPVASGSRTRHRQVELAPVLMKTLRRPPNPKRQIGSESWPPTINFETQDSQKIVSPRQESVPVAPRRTSTSLASRNSGAEAESSAEHCTPIASTSRLSPVDGGGLSRAPRAISRSAVEVERSSEALSGRNEMIPPSGEEGRLRGLLDFRGSERGGRGI